MSNFSTNKFLLIPMISFYACVPLRPLDHDLKDRPITQQQSNGALPSLVMLSQAKILQNNTPLTICIEAAGNVSQAKLTLETQMAYAAWLDATGDHNGDAWQLLDFTLDARCNMDVTDHIAVVKVVGVKSLAMDLQMQTYFGEKPVVTCEEDKWHNGCTNNNYAPVLSRLSPLTSIKNGYGLEQEKPGIVLFSPHVYWLSLDEELQANKSLRPEVSHQLQIWYKKLLSYERPPFSQLQAFNKRLESLGIASVGDLALRSFKQAYRNNKRKHSYTRNYTAELGMFPYLLAHVGRLFAVDAPPANSTRMLSLSTRQKERALIQGIHARQFAERKSMELLALRQRRARL